MKESTLTRAMPNSGSCSVIACIQWNACYLPMGIQSWHEMCVSELTSLVPSKQAVICQHCDRCPLAESEGNRCLPTWGT